MQTLLAQNAAKYLSNKLNTVVTIGTVDFELFKKIVLTDVYIEDLHHDTLLYSKKMKVEIDRLDFKNQHLKFGSIVLLNTKSKIIHYKNDEDYNIQFLIDAFASNDTTIKKSMLPWKIDIDEVTCVNIDFSHKNEREDFKTTGINYFDLRAQHINGRLSSIQIVNDTIQATIDYMAAVEKSGFIINNLNSFVKINSQVLDLKSLQLSTPYSDINGDLKFSYEHYRDYLDFIEKVTIKATFIQSTVELADIAYFAPYLYGIQRQLIVSGKVSGTIADLRGKSMDIRLGEKTQFQGDLRMTGLPKIEETVFVLTVKKLETNYKDLSSISLPPFTVNNLIEIPDNVKKLGDIHFKGTFTGLFEDFNAYGSFNTALGKIYSDISVQYNTEKKKNFYTGKLRALPFNFGAFFDIPNLENVTLNLDVDGSGFLLDNINANVNGTINSLYFNKYNYNNIDVKGNLAKKIFKGKLKIADENIDFDFDGGVDFSQKIPELDFVATVNKCNLVALNFIKDKGKKTNLSTKIAIGVSGNNIDNLTGNIKFTNTVYSENKEEYRLKNFDLSINEQSNKKEINLNSDFIDATVAGNFKLMDLQNSFERFLANYLPSYFSEVNNTKPNNTQHFDYDFKFKNTSDITALFFPKIYISKGANLYGSFNSSNNNLIVNGSADRIKLDNYSLENWFITSKSNGNFEFNTGSKKVFINDQSVFENIIIDSKAMADSIYFTANWDNKANVNRNKGSINSLLHLRADKQIYFDVFPSQVTVSDSIWTINEDGLVIVDTSHIEIKNIAFNHGNQSIAVNGAISKNKTERLTLALANFNLANINTYTKAYNLNFRGLVNGQTVIADFYESFLFVSENNFKSFVINENEFGDGELKSTWNNSTDALYINGKFTLGVVPNFLVSGYYYPKLEENSLDIQLNMEALKLQLFEPFVKDIFPDLKGFFAGTIALKGTPKNPLLSGTLNVNAKKVTVGYLNTTYNFSHTIIVENNSFGIENMKVLDANGNKAMVTGKVYHNNFKNFQLDFDIAATKFMCLNTNETDNKLFYGKAYASGIVNIYGFLNDLHIDANVRTEKITPNDNNDKINLLSKTELTKIFIPLASTSEINQNNYITFIKPANAIDTTVEEYRIKTGILSLDLNLAVTTDAELQLIFDQKVGDVIRARGNGNIQLKIPASGEFRMYGSYIIDDGDYLFTLQNIINKKFDIEKGSAIKWGGSPYNADLSLNAYYRSRAALSPFFPGDSTTTYKKRNPVDVKLMMTGDLTQPNISFDIVLPTADANIKQTVAGYINTDAEMNRQVFSLLILNSFVTPAQLANSGGGPTVIGAASSNSSELLSNQLSNMLSKISKDFDVGVKYRPGDAVSKNEVEVALSTQLFNDKLSIDGNVGVNKNNQTTNNIVGDVNIEYRITDDGKLRLKAFNRANDGSSQLFTTGPYTQGVGVFYRSEFNTFSDLFRRRKRAEVIKSKK